MTLLEAGITEVDRKEVANFRRYKEHRFHDYNDKYHSSKVGVCNSIKDEKYQSYKGERYHKYSYHSNSKFLFQTLRDYL